MKTALIALVLSSLCLVSAPVAAQTATIRIGEVEVYSTKSNGKAWDIFDGKPDIMVKVSEKGILGASKTTSTTKDSYVASIDEDTISISAGDAITITVIDDDPASDDEIGSFNYVVKAADIRNGGLIFHDFDRVENLEILFK